MADKHERLTLQALTTNVKGGTSRTPREETVEDDLLRMAHAHASIALKAFKQSGTQVAQETLETNITTILNVVLAGFPHPRLYQVYHNAFWDTYNQGEE